MDDSVAAVIAAAAATATTSDSSPWWWCLIKKILQRLSVSELLVQKEDQANEKLKRVEVFRRKDSRWKMRLGLLPPGSCASASARNDSFLVGWLVVMRHSGSILSEPNQRLTGPEKKDSTRFDDDLRSERGKPLSAIQPGTPARSLN